MRYDLNIRDSVQTKVRQLAQEMSRWEAKPRISPDESECIRNAITPFAHTFKSNKFRIGGVDGSGDYPSFSYADSFVFVASASGTIYRTDAIHGLAEEVCLKEPTLEFLWIPEDSVEARKRWIPCLQALSSMPVREVIARSDYKALKDRASRTKHTVDGLLEDLILPKASDTANVGIQLRSTAEFGTAFRLIQHQPACRYVVMDTTYSIPLVKTSNHSLFYEHLKRLCCVEAREREIFFLTISKSHGFPSMELIAEIAAQKLEIDIAEHWYMRIPMVAIDDWTFSLAQERHIPPVGAVSYLFRLHKNTPIMRIDMDFDMWEKHLKDNHKAEVQLFADLDYSGHDQRAYGYPYPIKASHDRSRLTQMERATLRKQIIDAAVAAGMKRALFRDVSTATGHK